MAKETIVGTGEGKNTIKIKPFNLDKLTEISIKLAMSTVESSCYQGLIENIKKTIREEINTLANKIKESINNDVKNILSKIDLNSKIEDLYNDCINSILNIFLKYIFLDANIKIENNDNLVVKKGENNYSLSKESQIIIQIFVTDYFESSLAIYKRNLDEFLEKYSYELSC